MNALEHGERPAEAMETRAMYAAYQRMLQECDDRLANLARQATESLD